jgi:hypothetical protein
VISPSDIHHRLPSAIQAINSYLLHGLYCGHQGDVAQYCLRHEYLRLRLRLQSHNRITSSVLLVCSVSRLALGAAEQLMGVRLIHERVIRILTHLRKTHANETD